MRQTLALGSTLAVGIALGAMVTGLVNAAHPPVAVNELLRTPLAVADGKEASIFLAELAPGAAVGKHYHPGDAYAYVLDGTMVLEVAGKPPVTLKTGESGYVLPGQVHDDKNASQTQPLKLLVFHVAPKGQPLAYPAQ